MAILDSLKKLGRKMTGNAVQGTDIESAIDSIANNYESGGSIPCLVFGWDENEENVIVKSGTGDEPFAIFPDESEWGIFVKGIGSSQYISTTTTYSDITEKVTMLAWIIEYSPSNGQVGNLGIFEYEATATN